MKTKIKYINARQWKIDPKQFVPFVKRLHQTLECWEGILNVIFVNDAYIQALNKSYRKKDKSTDVLSFNYFDQDPKDKKEVIGEIYLSVETAQRQAEAQGESLVDELNKLFVHGFLHIHGYDHLLDTDYKVMHALECEVLQRELPFISSPEQL